MMVNKHFFRVAMLFTGFNLYAQFPEFKLEIIAETNENLLCQQSLADLDADGDLDIIVGSNIGTIWWFENINGKDFTQHLLGENALTNKGGVVADIDGDGLLDQVSGGTWYKNPGNNTDQWQRFENGAIISYDMQAADINNDGKPEIVATSDIDGTYLYFPGLKFDKKWKKTELGDGVAGGISPMGIGDIDGDGDLDIVRSNLWYDNLVGDASKWSDHKTLRFVNSQGKFANSSRVYVIDMDGDGDQDVVQSESNNENGSIAWHENKGSRGINWYVHPVASETLQDLHSLCVADFDNDGDFDIFSAGGPMTKELYKRGFIWENLEKGGEKWEKHEVMFKQECIDAVAGDIDGDGDIDIVGKPWKGEQIFILRNQLK